MNLFKGWLKTLAIAALAAPAIAYSAPKTLLVLGDSLSAEYGIARGSGWVALMEQRLKEQKIDATVINASISGETTSGGRSRLPALLEKYHPSYLVIELGANDGLRGLPVKAAEDNLRAMTAAADKAGARVMLVGMRMPPNYGRAYTEQFFAMYGQLSKELKTPLVPFMLDGIADKPQLMQADRLHPLAEAHPTILATIWPTLQKMIRKQ